MSDEERVSNDEARAEEPSWFAQSTDEVLSKLGVTPDEGLSSGEAASRLERYGRNELADEAKVPKWRAFLGQYANYMQILLLVAAGLSYVVGDLSMAVLLFLLTVLNAVMGYRQEAKAEKSVSALKEMLHITARVVRDGRTVEVPAEELVPGDIVSFEAGDLVPADGRLVRASSLEIEESALTGESEPAAKGVDPVSGDNVPLGDRTCMAYMNSLVTRGTGTMVVTATGMATEIGHIAQLLGSVERDKSPLQKQIDRLTTQLGYVAVGAMLVVIGAGLLRDQDFQELFAVAAAMAVAAIPTGLPTLVTALLSLGTQQLAKAHAIVKNLTSVETLGSTSAICSDKTGTLTLNKMTATELAYAGTAYKVSGIGYSEIGQIQRVAGVGETDLEPVLLPMALCSDAVVHDEELVGDPTEGALVVLAAKGGIDVEGTRRQYPRLAEVPFDSEYKFMATFHQMQDENGRDVIRCFVKGAPDVVMGRSETVLMARDDVRPMEAVREAADNLNSRFAGEGLRVMALARRDFDPETFDPGSNAIDLIADLTLLGLVGIVDPPRAEARDAIAKAKGAGIRVRMITGDFKVTAGAIGERLGIEGEAISGHDLDQMDDEELARRLDEIGVIGRVAPEHKVRIVQALKAKGNITAMTGDGVNDAPALKAADIGIAMGITGTEVSKQAAEMILTDDNFATIVHAIELGRAIYDNMMKYIRYQLITLFAYITLFVGAAVFGIAGGAPLWPLQILWLNFAITPPLALALGTGKSSPDLMEHKPRDPAEGIMSRRRAIEWVLAGLVMAAAALAVPIVLAGRFPGGDAEVWGRTLVLTTLSVANVFCALSSQHESRRVFGGSEPLDVRFTLLNLLALLLALLVTELPFLQRIFGTTSLSLNEWVVSLAFAAAVMLVMELFKWHRRHQAAKAAKADAQSSVAA